MAKSDLRIEILGTSITISTGEDPGYLRMLLDKYRRTIENVQRISGLKDPLKTAVLTGFLLCDDLEKAGTRASGTGGEQNSPGETREAELLSLVISRLDEAVPDAVQESSGAPSISIYKLKNAVKNYAWGSPEWLPALLGQRNLSRIPWAELWMGVNPAGPSRVVPETSGTGEGILLSELIARDPSAYLGRETVKNFGKLPFLFKVEAAAKPLSIQAHPNLEQAREGFERENREGIPLDAPERNYRDSNHKPEIICALSPFAALCGFRNVQEIKTLIGILSRSCSGESDGALKTALESLASALEREDENPLKAFIAALFGMENQARQALGPFLKTRRDMLEKNFPQYQDEWKLCSYLASLYPDDTSASYDASASLDAGIIAPLYLNIIELGPGEAMYLPAGVFHAYIHGMGIELMADSDNVLRGGLTPKHVDVKELFRILNFSEYKPEILKVPGPASEWYTYPAPAREFTLSVMRGSGGPLPYPETGPSIVLVTQGSAVVTGKSGGGGTELLKGESAFIPAGAEKNLTFSGTFTAYVAACRSS
ncbi:MAG: mannose-6-phosphate isomerase, class I [Treponema sp.]|nr:mannose-6-phosphate isomerase, class I [Treponema sp.]